MKNILNFFGEEEENKNVCAAVAHHHHHLERLEFIFFLEIRSWWGCFWPGAFSSISESKKPPPSVEKNKKETNEEMTFFFFALEYVGPNPKKKIHFYAIFKILSSSSIVFFFSVCYTHLIRNFFSFSLGAFVFLIFYFYITQLQNGCLFFFSPYFFVKYSKKERLF
jgi:hypothetical protein